MSPRRVWSLGEPEAHGSDETWRLVWVEDGSHSCGGTVWWAVRLDGDHRALAAGRVRSANQLRRLGLDEAQIQRLRWLYRHPPAEGRLLGGGEPGEA